MAGSPVFVDTNVLIYRLQANSSFHEKAKLALHDLEADGTELWISRQVIREYLASMTRAQPNSSAIPVTTAAGYAEQLLETFNVADDGAAVTRLLLDLVTRFPTAGKQIHDANIVATMLAYRVPRLLTFNSADFRRFNTLIDLSLTPEQPGNTTRAP